MSRVRSAVVGSGHDEDDDDEDEPELPYIPEAQRRKLAEEAQKKKCLPDSVKKEIKQTVEAKVAVAASSHPPAPTQPVSKKEQLRQQVREMNQHLVQNLLVEVPLPGGSDNTVVAIPHPRQMAGAYQQRKRPR